MRDIAEDVEGVKSHRVLLHSTQWRHSTRASRLEPGLRVSVARPASEKECSEAGSGFRMAVDVTGTMPMGVGEGGMMCRRVCWW
jgi:hypothetical protein